MVFKILSSDLLISDIIVHADQNPAAATLIEELKQKRAEELHLKTPPDKISIDEEDFKRFLQVVPPDTVKEIGSNDPDPKKIAVKAPGGSSANVLTTMSKLLGKENVDIKFVGVVGDDPYGSGPAIEKSLKDAGITLVPPPESLPNDPPAHNAVSFVIVDKEGHRSIATYPGNAKDILEPAHITQELIDKSDAVFLQGSLYDKMPHIAPKLVGNHQEHGDRAPIANTILKRRWESTPDSKGHKKQLWLALPTQAKFDNDNGPADKSRDHPIASANVVLSNEMEMQRLFGSRDALDMLRDRFKAGVLRGAEQIGFITYGKSGVSLVTGGLHNPEFEYAANVPHIANDLGAGDTSYAGFLAGRVVEMSMNESAKLAMALAGAKLQVDGPRLDNPREALKAISPELSESFEKHLHDWQKRQQSPKTARAFASIA